MFSVVNNYLAVLFLAVLGFMWPFLADARELGTVSGLVGSIKTAQPRPIGRPIISGGGRSGPQIKPVNLIASSGFVSPEVSPQTEQTTLTGELQVEHVDNFLHPEESYYRYFLIQDNRRLAIEFLSPPEVQPGTPITVRGFLSADGRGLEIAQTISASLNSLVPSLIPETIGEQKTLIILARFQDSGPELFSVAEASEYFFGGAMQDFYAEQSTEQVSFTGEVRGWYTIPRVGDPRGECRWPQLGFGSELDGVIASENLNFSSFDRVVVAYHHPCMHGGHSTVGKNHIPINGQTYWLSVADIGDLGQFSQPLGQMPFLWTTLDAKLAHELGHSLGLGSHANGWDCDIAVLQGDCQVREYGNTFDAMGWGTGSLHFQAALKEYLGWLDPSTVVNITESGRYHLRPYEYGRGPIYAKISVNSGSGVQAPYYLEYRRGLGFDAKIGTDFPANQNGLMINQIFNSFDTSPAVRLLDLVPTATAWFQDLNHITLDVGAPAFNDIGFGITVGPVVSADETGITFDVTIVPALCERDHPRLELVGYQPTIALVGSGYLYFRVTNQDSAGCSPSIFSWDLDLPEGWEIFGSEPQDITVNPGLSGFQLINFVVTSDAVLGTDEIELGVTNLNTNLSDELSQTVLVVPTPVLESVIPPTAMVGQVIVLSGQYFATTGNNQVTLVMGPNSRVFNLGATNNGQTIMFPVPSTVFNNICNCEQPTPAGNYLVKVRAYGAQTAFLSLEILP